MRDIIKEAYENCEIEKVGFARPDPQKGDTLEGFQAVLLAAESMQERGLIFIQKVHRESQSGKSMIDLIQFMRVN